ncbi:hypothetical protein SPRG_06408 [Saprolegnia parasitica CBS 223.65]|uniref:Uncharacterized protein n=1 Tax=Saprolegnia parasitica (strain CBS 223.65) TaxID=695850 RepID=A0A067CH86_SAPPC|nr:hypothetical protein SPRG_06408 [Saprolegnia parasitica CBS 223.65]KDO28550.1 hypothetical protein SPRG_06408 [Saprolegnia parasitica CBS 223.65]|eukprot:XP_012200615.1 hypothetical protein SPRG_06408 [Saprolegnia parasitica CBS 223.65]
MMKKLVLHFDLNRTIVMSDVAGGRSMENTLNYLLSECTYGRVDGNEWVCVSKEPSLAAPSPSLVTYKKFVDQLYPYNSMASGAMEDVKAFNKSQKKQRTALQSAFTSGPGLPIASSYTHVLDCLHFPEGALRDAAKEAAKSLDESGLKEAWSAGRYYLLPSFLHFLHYMAETTSDAVELSVVFRTFGEDITEVAKELELLCNGQHPLFLGKTLPDSMRLLPPYATFYRSGFEAEGTTLAVNTLTKVPFKAGTTPASFTPALVHGFRDIQATLEATLAKGRRVTAMRDYWEWWSAHAEHAEYGKLLLVTPGDGPATVFFDDHIEATEAHIVDVRDAATGQVVDFDVAKDTYLKRVEPYYAITDPQYYIRHVVQLLAKL